MKRRQHHAFGAARSRMLTEVLTDIVAWKEKPYKSVSADATHAKLIQRTRLEKVVKRSSSMFSALLRVSNEQVCKHSNTY